MCQSETSFWRRYRTILWILLVGLIHGMVFVILIPPWQHYDEPGNFEYAWLLATQAEHPEYGDYDQNMRRELAASMVEHKFFNEAIEHQNLLSFQEPAWIGISQLEDSILYFGLVSIPLRLISSSDITNQLYAGRFISLSLYLVTIIAAYGTACTLVPEGNSLRWILPLTLVLMPGFTDLMTSVNNDAGAVAAFSLFLWGSTRMMRDGFSWKGLLWVLGSAILCVFTKRTVLIAVPLMVIPLLFGSLSGTKRKFAWGGLAVMLLAVLLLGFRWEDVANWQYITNHLSSTRAAISNAPTGDYAIRLSGSTSNPKPMLAQSISGESLAQLRDQQITAGAWIWGDEQAQARISLYNEANQILTTQTFDVSQDLQFVKLSTSIPEDAKKIQVALSAVSPAPEENQTVFFDAIILVPGNFAETYSPDCEDANCNQVTWGNESFQNLIQNSSAEEAWPGLSPFAKNIISKTDPITDPAITMSSMLNWKANLWYFKATAENLFRTFWAKFGWGHVPLVGSKPYRILAFLTIITVIAAILRLVRLRGKMPWPIVAFFLLALFFIWEAALLRGLTSIRLLSTYDYIPVARYAYPAIIPSVLMLNLGWLEISDLGKRWLSLPPILFYGAYILFFIILDLYSIFSIYNFYYLS